MITESLLDDEAWAEAPEDSEEAFLFLISQAKSKLLRIEDGSEDKGPFSAEQWRLQYVNEVATIAAELGISGLTAASDATATSAKMDTFDAQLARLVTRARVRNRNILREDSVELELQTKSEIREKIEALRSSVAGSNLSDKAKERLHGKIDEVEKELDKRRFDLRKMWLLAGAVGTTFGVAVQTTAALPEAIQTIQEISALVDSEKAKQAKSEQKLLSEPPLQIEDQSSENESG